jgi:nucleotide-binding universal stress UspA family protein
MKIMVAYDGTLQSKEALAYGMDKAREKGGEVVALHVFNSNMFVDYDAHLDAEAMARGEARQLVDEARALIREKGEGIRAGLFTTEGNPEEEIINFAKEKRVDVLLCPPRFKGIIRKYRRAVSDSQFADGAKDVAVLVTKTM